MSKFSKRLQELRQESNLSYTQLGNKIGVSNNAIFRWEQGTRVPNIISLELLAKFFNVSPDYLIGLKDE